MNLRKNHLKISFIANSRVVGVLLLCVFTLSSCATRQTFERNLLSAEEKNAISSKYPAPLQQYFIDLEEEGERNAVLNYMRLGKKAYTLEHHDIAHSSFMQAAARIESVYGYDQNAADVRSLWIEEGAKDFKGEPYERAMSYFYLGLTFIDQGDYENARASFMSGQLQDAFAEEDQNRCDFALLLFMEGWCSFVMKDYELAEQRFREIKKMRPEISLPEVNDNLLLLLETGTSPRKVADGPGHSELKFRRGRHFKEKFIEISFDGKSPEQVFPLEDIFYQAMTRGGREVDKIVEGKAVFRSTSTQAGSVLADIGGTTVVMAPLFSHSSEVGLVGGAIGLVGVTSMAIGQASRPHADTRYWDSLPDRYHLLSTHLTAGDHIVTVRYLDENKNVLFERKKKINIPVKTDHQKLLWIESPSQS